MGTYAKVVAYAFDEECKCVGYRFIPVKDEVSVNLIFAMVNKTFEDLCTAMEIAVLDNYPALMREFREVKKNDSVENRVIFKDLVERQGLIFRR